MASTASALIPCGQFKTDYRRDTTIFPTPLSRGFAIAAVLLLCLAPLQIGGVELLSAYQLNILIQIGYLGIAALGLTPLHRRTFSRVREHLEVQLPLEIAEPSLSSHTAIA